MMNEAEEEALFARLRRQLTTQPPSGADAQTVAMMAGLEASIEARVEAAVARNTAGLRADLDRLAERLAGPAGRRHKRRRRSAVLMVVLALLVGAGLAAWFQGEAIRNGVEGWRTAVYGRAV